MIGLVTENPNVIQNIKGKHEEVVIATKEMALQFLETLDWIGFDAETLGFDPYLSDLITIQMGNNKHQFVVDVKTVDITYFKDLLESKPLIGHNLKFDLRFLYHYRIIPYKVYDTFLAEKTTRLGITTHKSSLADTVKRHCNVILDKSVRASIDGSFNIPFIIYSALDVKYLHRIKETQLKILEEADSLKSIELDNRFVIVLAYIEYCGFKLDGQKWQEKTNKTRIKADKAKEELDKYILENNMSDFINYQTDLFSSGLRTNINWNSPQQVVQFFKQVGVNTTIEEKGEKKDTIDSKHLVKFQEKFPVIEIYLRYKQAQKDLGTYGDNWLRLINPVSGRVHTSYKQLMNTGRLSSGGRNKETGEAYPNFQNIPSDAETRSCFVADDGNTLITCDYTGQEQIVLVNKCLDKNLLEFYDQDLGDMHSFVASKMYPELDGMDLKEIKSKHKDKRQAAKVAGFAINYGGSGIGIADQLGLSVEQGQHIYDSYFKAFPGLKEYFDKTKKFGLDNGYVLISPVTGKKSYVDYYEDFQETSKEIKKTGFWDDFKKHKASMTVTYSSLKRKVSLYFSKKGDIERMSLNYPIQGESAEITKLSCVYFWEDYLLTNKLLFTVKFVNTIHDENVVECPDSIAEETAKALEDAMVKAGAVFCKRVPLKADPCISKYWQK